MKSNEDDKVITASGEAAIETRVGDGEVYQTFALKMPSEAEWRECQITFMKLFARRPKES